MSFEGFLGNAAALGRLRGLLASGRLAHAYLFAGPEGVGKKLAATEWARSMGATPIVVARLEDKHEVSIAQVRDVIRELSFTSHQRRVAIFDDAERMSEEAMNALLKTLEEPPAGTILILISSVPERLLATIRSRCQAVFFHPLPDEDIVRFLKSKGIEEPSAHAASAFAGGSIGAARHLAPDIGEMTALARELQTRVLSGELNPVVEALGKIKDTEEARGRAKRELQILVLCLRESLRVRAGRPPALATPEFVAKMSRLDEEEILGKIELLLDHQRAIDLNANVALAVEDALLGL